MKSEKSAADASDHAVVRCDGSFDIASLTDEQVVERGLALARRFYKSHGYDVAAGFRFYDSQHPHEQGMWALACIAFEELTGTDLNDALSSISD